MEIRARYFLIGLFVLAIAGAGFGFVYWLYNTGGLGERTVYNIRFDGSVSGLSAGSEVRFNGIKVGEVTGLRLNVDQPGEVIAAIAIDKRTPVRSDTHVGLAFTGLTGTPTVVLTGGTPSASPPIGADGEPPLLVADSAALQDLMTSGREALTRLNDILAENADSLHDAIANIDTFSAALARNSDKVDSILEGLQRLTGGGQPKGENVTYDLTAPATFASIPPVPDVQLTIPQPTAVVVLDTQRILLQQDGGEVPVFEDVRWADSLPLLVQARLIEGFENAGYPRVGTDLGGVAGDYQLLVAVRQFRIDTAPATAADVAFAARVIDSAGTVIDARTFTATEPVSTADNASAAATALGAAFGRAASEMIVWTLAAVNAGEGSDGEGSPQPTEALGSQ